MSENKASESEKCPACGAKCNYSDPETRERTGYYNYACGSWRHTDEPLHQSDACAIAAQAQRIAELEALAFAVGQCSPEDVPSAVYQAWSEPANYRESELVRLRDARDEAEDKVRKLERQLAEAMERESCWQEDFSKGCPHKSPEDACCQHPENTTPECHLWACPYKRPWELAGGGKTRPWLVGVTWDDADPWAQFGLWEAWCRRQMDDETAADFDDMPHALDANLYAIMAGLADAPHRDRASLSRIRASSGLPEGAGAEEVAERVEKLKASGDRQCESCGLWVQLNSPCGARGECCLKYTPASPVHAVSIGDDPTSIQTAFDFGCRAWIPRGRAAAEAARKGE